jgi:hypothetical protein
MFTLPVLLCVLGAQNSMKLIYAQNSAQYSSLHTMPSEFVSLVLYLKVFETEAYLNNI